MSFGCICEECLEPYESARWVGPWWCETCQRGAPEVYRAASGHHKVWVFEGPKPYRGSLVQTAEQIMGQAS